MAKQLVNPAERHVEKAVLGIAAILLIGVIAKYLVTSPNRRELDHEIVTPATIDEKVVQRAEAVRHQIRNAEPEDDDVERLLPKFVVELDPSERLGLLAELPAGVSVYPEVPIVDLREGVVGERVKLVEVIQLPKPATSFGRTTFVSEDFDGLTTGFDHRPVDWVTVSSVFDVKRQSELQRREYGPLREEVVYGFFEAQRRSRRPGGSWSDNDWEPIDPYPSPDIPPAPEIPLVYDRGKITLPKADYRKVERFEDDLSDPKTQLDLLRPMLPETINGDCPRFPLVMTVFDVAMQDDEYLFPDDLPAEDPEIRYPCLFEEEEEPEEEDLSGAEKIKIGFEKAERLLKKAWKDKNEDDAVKANNIAVWIITQPFASASDKTRAEKLKKRANQMQNDVIRWLRTHRDSKPGIEGDGGEQKREPLPKQQVWIHDARLGGVKGGQTYQYRMRPWVYNRLAGIPRDFENKADATTVFIPGPWSEPSDPVTIEPASQLFLTGFKEKHERVNVEFYQWFEGVWVKTGGSFGVGEKLSKEARAKVPDPEDPEGFDNAQVDFAVDAVIGDIDFDRSYRIPKRSGRGIKFSPPLTICSVVFVDPTGRLEERILPLDKGHPGKKALRARVWKAPKPKRVEHKQRPKPPKPPKGP